MTKQGREAGGIISILGGIYLIILNIIAIPTGIHLNFFIYIWIIIVLGILGGILLSYDITFGGGLSSTASIILLTSCVFGIVFPSEHGGILFLSLTTIGAGLMVTGGFIGFMIGPEPHMSISKSEFGLIDDWINMKQTEITDKYNVKSIEFFDDLWGGLVFEVKFLKNISPTSIKGLIAFLEKQWNGKVFIMTKAGLDEAELVSNKYIIYQKEGRLLNYKIEQIDLNE